MSRRRKDDGLTLDDVVVFLSDVPFWAGPILIVATFLLLYFVWPMSFSEQTSLSPIRSIGPIVAPFAAVAVFLAWILAELKKLSRRRLLDRQSGLDSIRAMTWQEFELLVGEAYRRQGYNVEETGTTGGDGGIDLALRGNGETVLVQCKQWRTHRVGVKPVRELYGVLMSEQADRAVLVACGTFTKEAQLFAQGKPIQLVASEELVDMVNSARRSHAKSAVQSATPSPVSKSSSKICPQCGAPMLLRTAKRGVNAGAQFWGCANFPNCRATESVDV